jgi:hypothetical protein
MPSFPQITGGSTNQARPGGRQTSPLARVPLPPTLSQLWPAAPEDLARKRTEEDEGRTVDALFSLKSWTAGPCLGLLLGL